MLKSTLIAIYYGIQIVWNSMEIISKETFWSYQDKPEFYKEQSIICLMLVTLSIFNFVLSD